MIGKPADRSRETRRTGDDVIDQRAQQIDPAGHLRRDVNAGAGGSMKQPGTRPPRTPRTAVRSSEMSGQAPSSPASSQSPDLLPSGRWRLRSGRTLPMLGHAPRDAEDA